MFTTQVVLITMNTQDIDTIIITHTQDITIAHILGIIITHMDAGSLSIGITGNRKNKHDA